MTCLQTALSRTLIAFAAFLLLGPVTASAQEKVLPPEALKVDLRLLHRVMERAHAGWDRYATDAELDRAFARAEASIREPGTEVDLFRKVAPLLAMVRDDHTYVLPSSAFWKNRVGPTDFNNKSTTGDLPLFPFFVTVEGGRLYVTHNNSADASVARGAEILKINGRSAADVVRTLERALPTSGYSGTYALRRLEQFSPFQDYNTFCLYYALMIEAPQSFTLQVRDAPKARPRTVTVAAVTSPVLWQTFRARYANANDPILARDTPLRLTFPTADTAILSLSSFHVWRWTRSKLDYRKDIAAAFATLNERGVRNLILDIRGNEGGDAGMAVETMAHLGLKPFTVYSYKEMTANAFPEFAAYVSNPKDLDHFKPEMFEPAPRDRIRIKTSLPDETWSRPLAPSAPVFAGHLWVLTDGATGSAAQQAATMIRVNRPDAVFVGEDSGGDMEGTVSGSYLALTLPNTGLRVDVPVLKKALNLNGYAYQRGRGVRPDRPVVRTQQDIIAARDAVLAYALEEAGRPAREQAAIVKVETLGLRSSPSGK